MPNRIIKESICTSDNIAELSWFEQVLFFRLIVLSDDFGAFDGRVKIIKGKGFPLCEVTEEEISDGLCALEAAGIVYLYTVDGKPYLQLKTWAEHQRVRNSQHKYPTYEERDKDCGNSQFMTSRGKSRQVAAKCGLNPIQSNPNPNPNIQSESNNESIYTTTTTDNVRAEKTPPKATEIYAYFKNELCIDNAKKEAEVFAAYNAKREWDCLPNWKAAADLWAERIPDHGG